VVCLLQRANGIAEEEGSISSEGLAWMAGYRLQEKSSLLGCKEKVSVCGNRSVAFGLIGVSKQKL
jgi:hypothetical protein